MANPPITIGPFANVPAPGSPIRSDWAQQISHYVTGLGKITAGVVSTTALALAATDQFITPVINIPAQTGWVFVALQLQLNVTAAPAAVVAAVQQSGGAVVADGTNGWQAAGVGQLLALGVQQLTGAAQTLQAYAHVSPGAASVLSQGRLIAYTVGNVPA